MAELDNPAWQQFKPDDHSELVPLLPIPNRTVKRLSADDSADSRVKVGHRQATYSEKAPAKAGAFASLGLQAASDGSLMCSSCEVSLGAGPNSCCARRREKIAADA